MATTDNGFGETYKVLRTGTTSAANDEIVELRGYDAHGNLYWTSIPITAPAVPANNTAAPNQRTEIAYDPLGRVLKKTNPDASYSTTDYITKSTTKLGPSIDVPTVQFQNEACNDGDPNTVCEETWQLADSNGQRIRQDWDDAASTDVGESDTLRSTSYTYDLLGQLTAPRSAGLGAGGTRCVLLVISPTCLSADPFGPAFVLKSPTKNGGLPYECDRSEIVWSAVQAAKVEAIAPEWVYRILIAGSETGLRPGDLVMLNRGQIEATPSGRRIRIKTSKRGIQAFIPVTDRMGLLIDATPSDRMLILTNASDDRLTPHRASEGLRQWRDKAGLDPDTLGYELRLNDTRGTAATRLLRAGLTLSQIAACMGWSLRTAAKMIERYARVSPDETDEVLHMLRRESRTAHER